MHISNRALNTTRKNFLDQLFVYHPSPWVDGDWGRLSALPLQDVWFQSSDGTRLFGWMVEQNPASPVLLWCHGNAGNIIHRLENLVQLHRTGFSVFLFDYRGYGRSQGKPSEAGLYRDAHAAYLYLTEQRRVSRDRLVIFGRSLGAAVAGDLVSRRPAAGVILESPFPSVASVARLTYFGTVGHWLLGSRFDLLERLPQISMPLLVIHGDRDHVIPLELGKAVYDAARPPKELYVVRGADHNDLYAIGGQAYFERLKQFVGKVIR
jgi:fermentation-respiration switch protein FrsA (DUF1100 family)